MLRNIYISSSPLDQFEIRDLISIKANILGNIQLSLTNMGIYLGIALLIILVMHLLSTNFNYIHQIIDLLVKKRYTLQYIV